MPEQKSSTWIWGCSSRIWEKPASGGAAPGPRPRPAGVPPRPPPAPPRPPAPHSRGGGSHAPAVPQIPPDPFRVRFSLPRFHGVSLRLELGFLAFRGGIRQRGRRGGSSPFPHNHFLGPKAPLPRAAPHCPFAPSAFSFFFYFFLFEKILAASSGPFPAARGFFSFPFCGM